VPSPIRAIRRESRVQWNTERPPCYTHTCNRRLFHPVPPTRRGGPFLRGLHSTLAVDAGVSADAVANALGHESFKTTAESHVEPEAVTRTKQRRVLKVLAGGRR